MQAKSAAIAGQTAGNIDVLGHIAGKKCGYSLISSRDFRILIKHQAECQAAPDVLPGFQPSGGGHANHTNKTAGPKAGPAAVNSGI